MLGYQGEEIVALPESSKENGNGAAGKPEDNNEADKAKDEKPKKNLGTTIGKSAPISGSGPEIASAPEDSKKVELTAEQKEEESKNQQLRKEEAEKAAKANPNDPKPVIPEKT